MYGKMQESGLTEIVPLICTSAICGQHPVVSHPESPWGTSLTDGLTMGFYPGSSGLTIGQL